MNLEEYSQYKETLLHEQPGFAYNTYLCTIPQDFTRVDLHWHEQMEIIYVKKGSGSVTVGSHKYPVEAGTIMPILPGELHAIDGDPGVRMEYENIIFSLSLMDNQVENDWARRNILGPLRKGNLRFQRPIHKGTPFHDEVSDALDAADKACSERSDGYSLLVRSSLFRFFYAIYTNRSREETGRHSQYEDVIKQVLLFVQTHFSEPITVRDAASLIDYSDAHFMRVFRKETGVTFGEYLADYRLRYASYLLREQPDSIGAIASMCGFDNFSYFIRRFRRKYGMSPREYRARER
jgi:AraC-like DNA-binding protein/quercetin dioxygenase-like cupin family protein